MPVPPPTPVEKIVKPTDRSERELVKLQKLISQATPLIEQRDRLMASLNAQGVTQRRLSELLTLGSVAAGGDVMTEHAVQRALRIVRGRAPRHRAASE